MEKITVSSMLSAMDNKPKSKAPAASYIVAIDLPHSDDEDEEEEIQPQEEEIGILTAKPRSLRSAGPADLSAATLSQKEINKRREKEGESNDLQKEIEEAKIVNVKLESAARPMNVPTRRTSESKFIKYRPSQQSATSGSGVQERIIRIVGMHVDPLEPPVFKYKRVPLASGAPAAVTVMQSPPRSATARDQRDWMIPPCTSNWKNSNGYAIPLDKRLAGNGRGLQEVQISGNFAGLSEALHVAEQKAREDVAMRWKVQRELMLKEKDRKEQELRALAQKARSERSGVAPAPGAPVSADNYMRAEQRETRKETREEREQRMERERLREERRRERERERRLEARDDAVVGKKSKTTRDRNRDISGNVALGMADTGVGRAGEVIMYDQRLFNQGEGNGHWTCCR